MDGIYKLTYIMRGGIMTAGLAPRVNALETKVAVLETRQDELEGKVEDKDCGLQAAHNRLHENDKLAVTVKDFITLVKWAIGVFVMAFIAFVFNLLAKVISIYIH
jgi:hypothetical protein